MLIGKIFGAEIQQEAMLSSEEKQFWWQTVTEVILV